MINYKGARAVGGLACLLAAAACSSSSSSGPKAYSFAGTWTVSGALLDGQLIAVEQNGDSVLACLYAEGQGYVTTTGSDSNHVVKFGEEVPNQFGESNFVLFTGQFVNANEVLGTVQTDTGSVTLTRTTKPFPCPFS